MTFKILLYQKKYKLRNKHPIMNLLYAIRLSVVQGNSNNGIVFKGSVNYPHTLEKIIISYEERIEYSKNRNIIRPRDQHSTILKESNSFSHLIKEDINISNKNIRFYVTFEFNVDNVLQKIPSVFKIKKGTGSTRISSDLYELVVSDLIIMIHFLIDTYQNRNSLFKIRDEIYMKEKTSKDDLFLKILSNLKKYDGKIKPPTRDLKDNYNSEAIKSLIGDSNLYDIAYKENDLALYITKCYDIMNEIYKFLAYNKRYVFPKEHFKYTMEVIRTTY